MTDPARGITAGVLMLALVVVAQACDSDDNDAAPAATTTSSATREPTTSTSTLPTTSSPTTGSSPATTTQGPPSGWTGPIFQADGAIPVAIFNGLLDSNALMRTNSPLRTALDFLQSDDTQARTTTASVTTNRESPDEVDVVVTADGMGDDSTRATRVDLHLTRQSDDSWRVASARTSHQCQPNRGHQDFTTAPCL